jgi:hypothetical protein
MKRAYKFLMALIIAASMTLFLSCGSSDCSDNDGDGYGDNCKPGIDCNDDDITVYPNAPEICDGREHRCPGDAGFGHINEECPQ